MKNLDDLKYICTNLGNLSGLPVRIYKDNEEIFYYSVIKLLKDPFILSKNSALKLKEDITYYQSPFDYFYAIINIEDIKIIVGPTRQIPSTKQELKSISFSLGIPISLSEEFIQGMESLVAFPLMSLLQVMSMIYFSLTGVKKSLENITIHEEKQTLIKEEIDKTDTTRILDDLEGNSTGPYNALDIENRLLDMVMRGDIVALKEFFKQAPAVRAGTIAYEQLRQSKNIFIVTATLVSRAAIRGGLDATVALGLSDQYIQKSELSDSLESITELSYRMVLDYAERVKELNLGQNPSLLVSKVANYIHKHLSEPIKTIDIANYLYMSRSRLSTNFKNETGINLSDYITETKIDVAKRLLRYSNKSLTLISTYLGFSSQSHFSKIFKDYTNRSPYEYRQMHKHY